MKITISNYITFDQNNRKILKWESFSNNNFDSIWQNILSDDVIELDLNGFEFLNPDGLIWIAFVCLWRYKLEKETFIILPNNDDQISFLKLINFDSLQLPLQFNFANEYQLMFGDKYKSTKVNTKFLSKIFLISENNWARASSIITNNIHHYLSDIYGISNSSIENFTLLEPFIDTIQELIHNIALHGGDTSSEGQGLVIYKPPPQNYNILRYCCSDIGKGFKFSLKNKHNLTCNSDKEAILQALLLRFFHKKEGIKGLFETLKFISKKEGKIGIRSGNSIVSINFSNPNNHNNFHIFLKNPNVDTLSKLCLFTNVFAIPGVHIFVDLKLKL